MTPAGRRILLVVAGLVAAAAILVGLLAKRGERTAEAERDAPINVPSRMGTAPGPSGPEAAVELDSAALTRANIATSVLHPAARVLTISLTGELTADPARITTLRAPLAGRVASEGNWPALGASVAAGVTIARVSDALPLALPRGGVVTRVSAQPGELVQAGQELLQVTDFTELLARVAWPPEAPSTPPRTLTLTPLGASGAMVPQSAYALADLVGPADSVDAMTRFPVYLYRTRAPWPGARPGAPVNAIVSEPGGSTAGVFVPTVAVVQWEGLAWVYLQLTAARDSTRFVRRRVDTSRPVTGGWLAAPAGALGVRAGDRIVVRGAQELLSEEFRSRLSTGD